MSSEVQDGRRKRGATTRARLVDASIALLARGGLAGLTASALAEEANVSKSTVFHHFPSLDRIPHAVLDHIIEQLVAAVQHHETPRGYLLQAGLDVLRLTADGASDALAMRALMAGADPGSDLARRLAALSIAHRDRMAEELRTMAPEASVDGARAVADLTVSTADGLALHLSLTGERQRLEQAWVELVEILLVRLTARPPSVGTHR